MRYSLLSRFQAGLWGAVIGEKLSLGAGEILKDGEICLSIWSQISMNGVRSLSAMGQLDLKDWQQRGQRLDLYQTATSGETAIATFGIMLYFHDSLSFLREKLTEAATIWLDPRAQMTDVLIWGEAIALALRERLYPLEFIPALLTDSDITLTPLGQQLEQVQQFLLARTPLQRVVASLTCSSSQSFTPIALALYCFLSTPEDFSLSVSRAIQTQYQPTTTATLAGMLSGVYNGLSALPLSGDLALFQQPLAIELEQLAWRLLRVWSGVYLPLEKDDSVIQSAIASPRVIQPRSTRQVISQRE